MLCKNIYIIGLQVGGKRVSLKYLEKLYKIQNDKYDAVSRRGLRVTRMDSCPYIPQQLPENASFLRCPRTLLDISTSAREKNMKCNLMPVQLLSLCFIGEQLV
jgi:hypothetical protein